jgi:phage baseplate assembly protein W
MATTTINVSREYSDLDLNFNIHPVRKDINKHKGEYAVINSVKNLILTSHYERPFQPDIGSNIRRLLFENLDSITAASLRREIEQTVENFEPRAKVSKTIVTPEPDKNSFRVVLEFYIINRTEPITINFLLERIR